VLEIIFKSAYFFRLHRVHVMNRIATPYNSSFPPSFFLYRVLVLLVTVNDRISPLKIGFRGEGGRWKGLNGRGFIKSSAQKIKTTISINTTYHKR